MSAKTILPQSISLSDLKAASAGGAVLENTTPENIPSAPRSIEEFPESISAAESATENRKLWNTPASEGTERE